jgi:hypothetical protein
MSGITFDVLLISGEWFKDARMATSEAIAGDTQAGGREE